MDIDYNGMRSTGYTIATVNSSNVDRAVTCLVSNGTTTTYWDSSDASIGRAAQSINSDGTRIAGCSTPMPGNFVAAWWSTLAAVGSAPNLFPGTSELTRTVAQGVSADGRLIVGHGEVLTGGHYTRVFRWDTSDDSYEILAELPSASESEARGISSNGSITVGWSGTSASPVAAYWAGSSAPVSVGIAGVATATTADGSIIVGTGDGDVAFVWSAAFGVQLLQDELEDLGVTESADWESATAVDISHDASVVVGYGRDATGVERGWVVHLTGTGIAGM